MSSEGKVEEESQADYPKWVLNMPLLYTFDHAYCWLTTAAVLADTSLIVATM